MDKINGMLVYVDKIGHNRCLCNVSYKNGELMSKKIYNSKTEVKDHSWAIFKSNQCMKPASFVLNLLLNFELQS